MVSSHIHDRGLGSRHSSESSTLHRQVIDEHDSQTSSINTKRTAKESESDVHKQLSIRSTAKGKDILVSERESNSSDPSSVLLEPRGSSVGLSEDGDDDDDDDDDKSFADNCDLFTQDELDRIRHLGRLREAEEAADEQAFIRFEEQRAHRFYARAKQSHGSSYQGSSIASMNPGSPNLSQSVGLQEAETAERKRLNWQLIGNEPRGKRSESHTITVEEPVPDLIGGKTGVLEAVAGSEGQSCAPYGSAATQAAEKYREAHPRMDRTGKSRLNARRMREAREALPSKFSWTL